jgi:hypothetical protein
MNAAAQLEEAVALALQLAPKERLQLIERVAASVERDIEAAAADQPWGKSLVRMLSETEPIELVHSEIDDATEWVRQIRRDQAARRGIDWDEAE